jgi:hypothetical protein
MLSAVCGCLTNSPNTTNVSIGHIPKSSIYLSRTLKGLTPDGRYIHLIKNGRVTYHPGYYTIDGRLLQPHT